MNLSCAIFLCQNKEGFAFGGKKICVCQFEVAINVLRSCGKRARVQRRVRAVSERGPALCVGLFRLDTSVRF